MRKSNADIERAIQVKDGSSEAKFFQIFLPNLPYLCKFFSNGKQREILKKDRRYPAENYLEFQNVYFKNRKGEKYRNSMVRPLSWASCLAL